VGILVATTHANSVAQMQEMGQVLERINLIRLLKMTDALSLERDTAVKLASVSSRYCETQKGLLRNMRRDIDALRQILADKSPDEQKLKEIIDRTKKIRKELANLRCRQMDDEMILLTPIQQAQYLIFKVDFHREMHELIKKVNEGEKKATK
jgi:Spy/CpxP family protein refolding chaperone